MLIKLRKLIIKMINFFPSPLPTTMFELDDFINSIIDTYSLPDMAIYHEAIATAILHVPPHTAWKSKAFFATSVKKTMANRVAYEVLQLIKKQDAEALKAKELADAENQAALDTLTREANESSINEQPKEA